MKFLSMHLLFNARSCSPLLLGAGIEFNPTASVIGGILAREILKAISGKDEPLKNTIIFNGQATAAYVINA